jgi:hypothetical protein
MACEHEHVRFLALTAADRMPGVFVCDDCGEKFSKHPNKPDSVRYLNEPNKNHRKVLPPLVSSKK